MNWKDTITAHSARILSKRDFPLLAKDLAWRLIKFATRCGRSNPFSFALRPLASHKHLRVIVGVNLAILAGALAIYGPIPAFAGDSIGGQIEINVRPEGEISLATIEAVQIPLSGYRLTQSFNWYHPGLDLAAPKGTPVFPVMTGRVAEVEYGRFGYGNNIVLAHANGYETRYAHLSKIEVAKGQEVNLGSEIGQVGSTGRSSGPHLHLEVYANTAPVNPKAILDIK
ncbi:MAG: M23 family metallopeptidase [bacterium]|nr:M23 family metallopeptidase [bacterium]